MIASLGRIDEAVGLDIKALDRVQYPALSKKRKALAARKKLLKRLAQERKFNG